MKKIIAAVLCIAIVFGLTGCIGRKRVYVRTPDETTNEEVIIFDGETEEYENDSEEFVEPSRERNRNQDYRPTVVDFRGSISDSQIKNLYILANDYSVGWLSGFTPILDRNDSISSGGYTYLHVVGGGYYTKSALENDLNYYFTKEIYEESLSINYKMHNGKMYGLAELGQGGEVAPSYLRLVVDEKTSTYCDITIISYYIKGDNYYYGESYSEEYDLRIELINGRWKFVHHFYESFGLYGNNSIPWIDYDPIRSEPARHTTTTQRQTTRPITETTTELNVTEAGYPEISEFDTLTLTGTLTYEYYEINSFNTGYAWILELDEPLVAVVRGGGYIYEDGDIMNIDSVHVVKGNNIFSEGEHVTVTGEVMFAHTGHHRRDIVLTDCYKN